MCMNVCTHVYVRTCICMRMRVCMCVYVSTHACLYGYGYICMCTCTGICVHVCPRGIRQMGLWAHTYVHLCAGKLVGWEVFWNSTYGSKRHLYACVNVFAHSYMYNMMSTRSTQHNL